MSLGLPRHLSAVALTLSLARGAHALGLASLICGLAVVVAFASAQASFALWPAFTALVVMGATLLWVDRSRRRVAAILHLALGTLCTFVFALTIATELRPLVEDNVLWLAFPKIALVMVAGGGLGISAALGWTIAGYVLAGAATTIALNLAGVGYAFDYITLAIFVVGIGVSSLTFAGSRMSQRTQPGIQRAAQDELLDDMRARIELRAAALMHDTILSHLAAIANSTSPTLQSEQKEEIERDLQILIGQEWLQEDPPTGEVDSASDWRTTPLNLAIQEARRDGLDIRGTGDFAAITRLDAAQNVALGLSAKQCLVNVIKHSGVMKAEVAVYGSDDEISVMIIDAGRGFSDTAVGADRLGLRASVLSRIESVGGLVQVWSTPGSGTSILLQLPVTAPVARGDAAPSDGSGQDSAGESP